MVTPPGFLFLLLLLFNVPLNACGFPLLQEEAGPSSRSSGPHYGIDWTDVDTGRAIGQDWVSARALSEYVPMGRHLFKRRSTLSPFDRMRRWIGGPASVVIPSMNDRLERPFLSSVHGMNDDVESVQAMLVPDEFIITGDAFEYLKTYDPHLLGMILLEVRIFARFSPEQKTEVTSSIPSFLPLLKRSHVCTCVRRW